MSQPLCRTCLSPKEKQHSLQLLTEDLLQKIEALSGLEITLHETFPTKICLKCIELLNISSRFREMCRSSENALLSLMVQTDVKEEFLAVVDNFDNNDDFFEELIDGADKQEIAVIEDFKLQGSAFPEVLSPDDVHSVSSFEHIASDSESILGLINENKPKLNQAKTTYKKTIKKIDKEAGSIMCEICGNTYKQRSLLNMHMRRHLEDKPFECEICSKAFTCASELRRHIRIHTGEKPYVCRFCGRTFTDRSTNIRHERIHTNTRPYTCGTCGKSFTYSTVLKNHMLIHTGEKKFACAPCNKTFSRKHQLDQHCATITHQETVRAVCIINDGIINKIEAE